MWIRSDNLFAGYTYILSATIYSFDTGLQLDNASVSIPVKDLNYNRKIEDLLISDSMLSV